jgi:uncharacterized membrane protein YdfJ with MMPL/SSD domain
MAVILDVTLMRMVVVPPVMVLMKKYELRMPFVKSDEQKRGEQRRKNQIKTDRAVTG